MLLVVEFGERAAILTTMAAATVHVSAADLELDGTYEPIGELVATLRDGRRLRLGRDDLADTVR